MGLRILTQNSGYRDAPVVRSFHGIRRGLGSPLHRGTYADVHSSTPYLTNVSMIRSRETHSSSYKLWLSYAMLGVPEVTRHVRLWVESVRPTEDTLIGTLICWGLEVLIFLGAPGSI